MDGDGKRYLFQLTKEDINKLFRGASPKPGFLIRIDNTQDGVTISIDEKALKYAIYGYLGNVGIIPGRYQRSVIDNASFNPVFYGE